MSAEQAVRRRVADVLRGDGALMALVHQVYETYAPRMHMPYVRLDGAEGREWGTKEREGREVVVTMSLVAAQGQAQGGGAAMGMAGRLPPATLCAADGAKRPMAIGSSSWCCAVVVFALVLSVRTLED